MLFCRRPDGHWGVYQIPFSVFQVYSNLDERIPGEWLLKRRILGRLTLKSELKFGSSAGGDSGSGSCIA